MQHLQTPLLSFLCFLLFCQVATLNLVCLTFDLGLYPERRATLTSAGYGRTLSWPPCEAFAQK